MSVTKSLQGVVVRDEDTGNAAKVQPASTAPVAGDPALTVTVSPNTPALPVTDNGGSLTVDGPLTDAELRATAVPVSDGGGVLSVDDAGGSLTVDGPLTDAELRATAVPVSQTSQPLPTGAASETTLATLATETKLEAVRALVASLDGKDFATQTTLATLATEVKLEAVRVLLASLDAKDYATQTTLAALNAKDFATEAKLEAVRVLLASLDGKDFATQTTLATRVADATITARLGVLGQAAMAASAPVVIASDQSAVASKNAAASQADGHSVTVGALADADSANTVIGRLKHIITRLNTQLPAALTGSGSLKAAIVEAIAAGTNVIGKTVPSTLAGVVMPVLDAVAIPASTAAMLFAGKGPTGNARFVQMVFDGEDSIYRVAVSGKVSVQIPPPPEGGVEKQVSQNDANLDVSTTHDTTYVITNAKTFVIQQVVVGAEGDPNEKGSKVEIIYYDGTTEHLVDRIYISGTSLFGNYPDASQARDGTAMTGNGTTKTIIIRRTRLGGAALEIDCVVRGYEI